MSVKLLRYDRNIVPQERFYDCGPAATEIVLNALGIRVSETELIREIGTTERGTDYVGLIERYLDRRLPNSKYRSVYIENDPPNAAQCDELWRNVVRSIDSGHGVIMNWVSPPGNRPIGIKGTASPNYGNNTVHHYVDCMGYDSSDRSLWITDSGFRPFEYWVSFQNAATLIPPKGYCFADLQPAQTVPAPPQRPATVSVGLTAETLSAAMGGAVSLERYAQLLPFVKQALQQSDCYNLNRTAMWLAQIGHESGGLKYMQEIANGAAYEGRADLGNTRPGDGPRYKGRGPIQITGRSNYTKLSEWAYSKGIVPNPTFFVTEPQALELDKFGFLGAVWYWTVARPNINSMCDAGNLEGVTRAINGGLNGIDDRRRRWERCLSLGWDALNPGAERDVDMSDRLPSRSPLRHLGEGPVDNITGMQLNMDANIHILLIKSLAEIGDQYAIGLLAEIAGADQSRFPDRQNDAALARLILSHVEKVNPVALQQFMKKG